jgi:hypothetical protein
MRCVVNSLPPFGCTYQIGLDGGDFDVELYPVDVNCTEPGMAVGQVMEADHTPTRPPPCEAQLTIPFIRGDCDGSGDLRNPIADAIALLGWSFLGNPEPPCLAACDANGDNDVRTNPIADAVYILQFWFSGTAAPPAPYPDCGNDITCLSCGGYMPCEG